MGTHTTASCLPYHSHSDLGESSVILHRYGDNTIYTPALSQYYPNVCLNLFICKDIDATLVWDLPFVGDNNIN